MKQNEGNENKEPHGSLEIVHFLTRAISRATLSLHNVATILIQIKIFPSEK
jgi:hypothetical protein